MAKKNPAAQGQPKELEKIDALKERLLGTDREDHWIEVLDMEKEIKRELLKLDVAKHKGMQMLIEWLIARVRDSNELLARAKSTELTNSQRDGLIEMRDFIVAMVRFLDPKGTRIKELNKELDFQLEDEDDDGITDDMISTEEDPTAPKKV